MNTPISSKYSHNNEFIIKEIGNDKEMEVFILRVTYGLVFLTQRK
jgi:hypothetical protein